MSKLQTFDSREALFDTVSRRMAESLKSSLSDKGTACAALSGGSTPAPIYQQLSEVADIAWEDVTLTLADERMTEPGDTASNEVLVRRTLIQNKATDARFLPLTEDDEAPGDIDVILLGMGGDGHFASLFPNAEELEHGLAMSAPPVLRMTPNPLPANAPFPRLTLTLPKILSARRIILAITGDEKRDTFERAEAAGPIQELPVRALLQADHADLTFVWAP